MLFKKNIYKNRRWIIEWLRHHIKVKNGEADPIDEFEKEEGKGEAESPKRATEIEGNALGV